MRNAHIYLRSIDAYLKKKSWAEYCFYKLVTPIYKNNIWTHRFTIKKLSYRINAKRLFLIFCVFESQLFRLKA
jgi:hypothetical protein